jgi:UDP-N-acetyl-D-mannosaminuronate dehydrogenase
MSTIDVVVGLGEIGYPIHKLLSKTKIVLGYDINPKLMNKKKFNKYENSDVKFLHICIPFNNKFSKNCISLYKKFNPKIIVIHSTIPPYTTKKLQEKISVPVIYSATRGIHKRMLYDLKRYTKFFALEKDAPRHKWASSEFSKFLKICNVKTKKISDPITLELAKIIVDTSYYGWLINYSQLSNIIAKKHNVDYDEMWEFSDEIHKFLGNRPKMYPGFIGGHCVIPNLSLIDEESLWQIDRINNLYSKKVKNAKSIAKKYVKGKQSYDNK